MIKFELMDEPIEIQQPVKTPNEFGEDELTYVRYAIDWAAVKIIGGSEQQVANKPVTITNTFVTIRWREGIKGDMRIKMLRNNAILNISAINDRGKKFGEIVLTCQQLQ